MISLPHYLKHISVFLLIAGHSMMGLECAHQHIIPAAAAPDSDKARTASLTRLNQYGANEPAVVFLADGTEFKSEKLNAAIDSTQFCIDPKWFRHSPAIVQFKRNDSLCVIPNMDIRSIQIGSAKRGAERGFITGPLLGGLLIGPLTFKILGNGVEGEPPVMVGMILGGVLGLVFGPFFGATAEANTIFIFDQENTETD